MDTKDIHVCLHPPNMWRFQILLLFNTTRNTWVFPVKQSPNSALRGRQRTSPQGFRLSPRFPCEMPCRSFSWREKRAQSGKMECQTWMDGLDWIGLDWIGLDWIGLDWIGLDWIGLDWIGLDWIGLDWIGLDWIGLDWMDGWMDVCVSICRNVNMNICSIYVYLDMYYIYNNVIYTYI